MRGMIAASLGLLGLAAMLGATMFATAASTWPPSDCYEGYAVQRGTAVRHYAIICAENGKKAVLDVYYNTAHMTRAKFNLDVRVDADTGTDPSARAETWIIDGEESLRFASPRTPLDTMTFWSPAAGGGHVGQWNFVALRYYG